MFSLHYNEAYGTVSEFAHCGLYEDAFATETNAYNANLASIFWHPNFGQDSPFTMQLLERSKTIKHTRYANHVFCVAPLYVTSICSERCLYCNFRSENTKAVARVRLSDEELLEEALFLVREKGLRGLELVYSSDSLINTDAICRHIESVKALLEQYGGGCVGLNAEPFEEKDYARMVSAGLSFAVIWQETYDRQRYKDLHPGSGKKSCFEYRLEAPERMLSGGLKNIGMGVLTGLSDWRVDWAMLMQHEAYLHQKYSRGAMILGIPRLKPAAGAEFTTTKWLPTTNEFLSLVAVHNIFSPQTCAFVNSRENWGTCIALAQGGGCLFTLNCSTIPGGYSLKAEGYQFPTESFDAPVGIQCLKEAGLIPVDQWMCAADNGLRLC